jgi:formylglycine-generating enzyme required for sulfatase activity
MLKIIISCFIILLMTSSASGADKMAETKHIKNSLGMMFIWIPPGDFMMGATKEEMGRRTDEPQHRVAITRAFYLQSTEVTQGQWRAVMGRNPSFFKACGDNYPVEQVSWQDAQEFIRRLNKKEGTSAYRLPTEAEWEYAARAGSNATLYAGDLYIVGGNETGILERIAWFNGNSCGENKSGNKGDTWHTFNYVCRSCSTQEVGQKPANPWGLYDMLGNVWEWVQDWQGAYPTDSVADPVGPPTGTIRVFRGGSWLSGAGYCLPSVRGGDHPAMRDLAIGFRLVKAMDPYPVAAPAAPPVGH